MNTIKFLSCASYCPDLLGRICRYTYKAFKGLITGNYLFYANSFLLFLTLTLFSCSHSPLSDGQINDITLIGAEIDIYQDGYDKHDNQIVVELFDEDHRRISNDSIQLLVNDAPLELKVKNKLYYTEDSYYYLSEVPVTVDYRVEVILSDGKRYLSGQVEALDEESRESIACNEEGDPDQDFVITWKDLKSVNEMTFSKSMLMKSKDPDMKNYEQEPEKMMMIKKEGSFKLPKSDYKTSESTISSLEIIFQATKHGNLNPELLKGSSISVKSKIEKRVNFEE